MEKSKFVGDNVPKRREGYGRNSIDAMQPDARRHGTAPETGSS